ncbi:MAG: membrane protein insertase YidC [Nitriliruptorales bacterium]|nr:membrane protein insertase YidC [Nitriliruptorales bacterium]
MTFDPWGDLLAGIAGVLRFFHGMLEGVAGADAWGWAIILLTIAVRIVLLPLAVKQIRSQRAMQSLQPEMKKIQSKYKADRGMMRSDPEKYRELRGKQQEATMALYKEHGVNPASGCLPLLLQMPIFFALFRVLQPSGDLPDEASFYIFNNLSAQTTAAGAAGWILVVLMAATTYLSARQMMSSTAATGQAQQQQKIMMYAMPLVLIVFSVQMFIGVLIYWVTTNLWTIAQQYVMFRATHADSARTAGKPPTATPTKPSTPAKSAKPEVSRERPKSAKPPKSKKPPKSTKTTKDKK